MNKAEIRQAHSVTQALAADQPQIDPEHDAFGYAAFAQTMAAAIQALPNPQGQIIAIHGPWGSGKTSFLNFVKHHLPQVIVEKKTEVVSQERGIIQIGIWLCDRFECFILWLFEWLRWLWIKHPALEQPVAEAEQFIIINFNPWWFAGHEQLAGQFLAQFAAQLPDKEGRFSKFATKLAAYAQALEPLVSSLPLGMGAVFKLIKNIGQRKTKDVPTLKNEISAALKEANQRFLIVIDDIDRLEPKEIRELFKVLKALADFPNVIYLLAFDREMVAQALEKELGIDGNTWLKKIVQAPFSLPKIMPEKFKEFFFGKVFDVLAAPNAPNPFRDWGANGIPPMIRYANGQPKTSYENQHYVYDEGLKFLIQTPRDLVRLIGSLSVTYPAVRDQVDPLKFLILECLRIFRPTVYTALRDYYKDFSATLPHDPAGQDSQLKLIFTEWRTGENAIPDFGAINFLLRHLEFAYMATTGLNPSNSDTIKPPQDSGRLYSVTDPNCFQAYFQFTTLPTTGNFSLFTGLS